MLYQRSRTIENRLRDVFKLIRNGGHSTPTLAHKLDISQPTISRCLTALRERGYVIRSVKDDSGWSYESFQNLHFRKGPRADHIRRERLASRIWHTRQARRTIFWQQGRAS
jgi:biotin operon repressor